jgi:hypothetical protein
VNGEDAGRCVGSPYNYKDGIHICNAVRRRIEQEIPRGLTTSSISTSGEMGSSW